jgi:hypothetical protein
MGQPDNENGEHLDNENGEMETEELLPTMLLPPLKDTSEPTVETVEEDLPQRPEPTDSFATNSPIKVDSVDPEQMIDQTFLMPPKKMVRESAPRSYNVSTTTRTE